MHPIKSVYVSLFAAAAILLGAPSTVNALVWNTGDPLPPDISVTSGYSAWVYACPSSSTCAAQTPPAADGSPLVGGPYGGNLADVTSFINNNSNFGAAYLPVSDGTILSKSGGSTPFTTN